MQLTDLRELIGKTGYMSRVYRCRGDDGRVYLLKRNNCPSTLEELEFMQWLMGNKHSSLLAPAEIRGNVGEPLEEIYLYIGPPKTLLDDFLTGLFPLDGRVLGGWNFKLALSIMGQIAFALGLINSAGFVKHDLKPKDVFVDVVTLETIVFDYNCVARPYRLDKGHPDTWNDVPPEFRRGNTDIDYTFDVYQVGRLCRAMIYGLTARPEAQPRIQVPDSALEVIAKATREDKNQRYKNCRDLHEALVKLA